MNNLGRFVKVFVKLIVKVIVILSVKSSNTFHPGLQKQAMVYNLCVNRLRLEILPLPKIFGQNFLPTNLLLHPNGQTAHSGRHHLPSERQGIH